MDQETVEGLADWLYGHVGLDPDEPVWTPKIAVALFGAGCFDRVDSWRMRGEASLVRVGDRYRIFVRRHLPPERVNFLIGHELGHWLCQREDYREDDIEETCDGLGAAIVAPRRGFLRLLRVHGEQLSELGAAVRATESLAVLRLGETTGMPLALVAPVRVRVRGAEWAWPAETEIRRLARRPAHGLRKIRLGDDPRRAALLTG